MDYKTILLKNSIVGGVLLALLSNLISFLKFSVDFQQLDFKSLFISLFFILSAPVIFGYIYSAISHKLQSRNYSLRVSLISAVISSSLFFIKLLINSSKVSKGIEALKTINPAAAEHFKGRYMEKNLLGRLKIIDVDGSTPFTMNSALIGIGLFFGATLLVTLFNYMGLRIGTNIYKWLHKQNDLDLDLDLQE